MVITVAIVGILASAALPLTELSVKRAKEQQLQEALRQIRTALDDYKRAVDEGRIARSDLETGYPRSLALSSRACPIKKALTEKSFTSSAVCRAILLPAVRK